MRHSLVLTLAFIAILSGCTSRDESSRPTQGSGSDSAAQAGKTDPAAREKFRSRQAIASLPDRGELLHYASPPVQVAKGRAAPVRVSISEEHAFRAIHRKELELEAPDGERIALAYARHEDHGDGNWTWVGRAANGGSAVLTFGQDAVFGSVQRPDGSELRITTQHRRTYAVVVRPDQLRGVETSTGSDFLIAPDHVAQVATRRSAASRPEHSTAGAAPSAAAAAAAANEVDVLLGYSTGLAQRIGSASGAETRMQSLIAISNEGYQNSGVVYRARLVGTVQVAYGDSSRNDTTLHALTGSTGSGSAPIDPAFNALRAAREQTGADLVSFVRQFREPDQDGCGIAWLLGGQQSTIDQSDAPFAYSVVSDGSDLNESDNRTYFCREETLAHELGHTMGQTHNTEDSSSTGAHAYSYGYREASTSGFYTIMAYRIADSSQVAIRYFANPGVAFQGRATGVANQSDNVRSMNQTMPVIATFRASLVGARTTQGDINGDSRADIFWHNASQNRLAFWFMNGNQISQSGVVGAPTGGVVLGSGDFDCDGRAEILWSIAGSIFTSRYLNGGFSGSRIGSHDAGWNPRAADDINGDACADVLWHNPGQARIAYWFMNSNGIAQSAVLTAPAGFVLLGTGDVDGNGRAELLWSGGGRLYASFFNGSSFDGVLLGSHDSGWNIVAAADINADGRDDIVWHNPTQQRLAYWLMNGTTIAGSGVVGAPAGLSLVGAIDLNGSGSAELVWAGNGAIYSSTFTGSGFSGAQLGTFDAGWVPYAERLAQ